MYSLVAILHSCALENSFNNNVFVDIRFLSEKVSQKSINSEVQVQ